MCKIISETELQNRTYGELSALFRKVADEVEATETGSPDREKALGRLETVRRALAVRCTRGPKPPGF